MTRLENPVRAAIFVLLFWGPELGGGGGPYAIQAQESAVGVQPSTPVVPGLGKLDLTTDVPVLPPTATQSTTATVKVYQPEEINPGEFILPFGRGSFTKEERKRLMELPGVKIVRAGPPGTPFHRIIRFWMEPWDDHQFRVQLRLEQTIMPLEEAEALIEIGRKLKADRPENPGRSSSFPKWTTVAQPGLPALPLIQSGWSMTVEKVQTLVEGWRAWVTVRPILRTDDYEEAHAHDCHYEVYLYKQGKLTLEKDSPDPKRTDDPMNGIRTFIKGRAAPVQVAPEPVAPKPAA